MGCLRATSRPLRAAAKAHSGSLALAWTWNSKKRKTVDTLVLVAAVVVVVERRGHSSIRHQVFELSLLLLVLPFFIYYD